FIFQHFRYIFPEYLSIDSEFEIDTIDSEKKYVDFRLKSQSSHLLLELKLPTQKIMSSSKDRNNYYFVAGINKAIIQLNRYYFSYKHSLYKEGRDYDVKTMLLVGWNAEFKNEEAKVNNDFELARSMYNNIQLVTYSEILKKIKNLYSMVAQDS
ncbi:MAG: Shedu anti-phage system protein SduA domain-containing protein, partial [archaeon]